MQFVLDDAYTGADSLSDEEEEEDSESLRGKAARKREKKQREREAREVIHFWGKLQNKCN